jgi:hypothetical protein
MPRTARAKSSPTTREHQAAFPKAGEQDLKFIIADGSRPAHYLFPSSKMLSHPTKGKQMTARYVRGVSTIWQEDQPSEVTRSGIHFIDGDLFVSSADTALQEYMLLILSQEGEGCTFKIDDPEEDARKANIIRRAKSKATSMITEKESKEVGKQELMTVARFYAIDADNLPFEVVIDSLWAVAEKKPVEFIDCFNNPSVKMKSLMVQGKASGLFLFDDPNAVKNSRTSEVICTIPIGVDPLDALTRHALSDEGQPLVQYVEKEIK